MVRPSAPPALLSLTLVTLLCSSAPAQEAWPDPGWQPVADLESAGWSPEGLADARQLADSLGTAAYMVVEAGRVVDTYGDATHRYRSHSVRKSMLSALYGIAWDRDRVRLDATLVELGIDDYGRLTDGERRTTLRQLLQSRSGVYLPAAYENQAFEEVRPERVLAAKRSSAPAQEAPWPRAETVETPSAAALLDSVIALPNPRGPYQVGTATRALRLEAPEELTEDPTDHRQLVVQLFYPARRTGDMAPAAYMPELEAMQQGLREHGFPPFADLADRLSTYRRVQTAAWPEEPILSDQGPFPVVLLSPGANVFRHWYTGLAQELASHGYVVALMSHAHSTLELFPGTGFLASHRYWHPGPDVPEEERAARDDELSGRLAGDAGATLDYLERLAASDTALGFRGALDLHRVGIVGHSRGGSTVTRGCATDRRLRACMVMDNIGSAPQTETGLDRPQLALRAPWPEEREHRLYRFLSANPSPAFDVEIIGAEHMSFSDAPLVDPETHPPGDLGPHAAHSTISSVLLGFLDEYVLGEVGAFGAAVAEESDRIRFKEFRRR